MRMIELVGLLLLVFTTVSARQATPETTPAPSTEQVVRARFIAEQTDVMVGQPLVLVLEVLAPSAAQVFLPRIPGQWDAIEIRAVSVVDVQPGEDDTLIYRQQLSVLLWQTGEFNTPEMYVTYRLDGDASLYDIPVASAFISVTSVLDDTRTLRPLKPALSLPYLSPLLVLLVFGLALLMLTYGGRALRRRWGRLPLRQQPALSPLEQAKQELERLRAETAPDLLLGSLSACLRAYVGAELGIPAPQLTTSELSARLETLPENLRRELLALLGVLDTVRFTGMTPQIRTSQRLLERTERWILASAAADAGTRDGA